MERYQLLDPADVSRPSSVVSSREPSPAPTIDRSPYLNGASYSEKISSRSSLYTPPESLIPGKLPTDVYDATLPPWRAAIRRVLLPTVRWESKVLAKMQEHIRTPWLDTYFVYASSLGTHTFFMAFLPLFFFFGYGEMGRGLIIDLALGVYLTSVIKDLICSPRPFAPPVTRMTIGSHHLEYGFPSTHSTNSVSIALFFFSHFHNLYTSSNAISSTTYTLATLALLAYTFSIVFGRLYTGMHCFTDCAIGVVLGTLIWQARTDFAGIPVTLSLPQQTSISISFTLLKGLNLGTHLESWVRTGGWEVPFILIPLFLLAVNQHPQPVDDCPCFEDAIAFVSVVLGALVGRWGVVRLGLDTWKMVVMPGSGLVFDHTLGEWVNVPRGWGDVGMWWGVAVVKMVVGILAIFTFRLLAKSTLHLILPPTFRLLSKLFSLPNRRFYTPATQYKNVPSEFTLSSSSQSGIGIGILRPIPSVIDLPGTREVGVERGGIGSGVDTVWQGRGGRRGWGEDVDIKMRGGGGGNGNGKMGGHVQFEEKDGGGEGAKEVVKHYDADVLTKFFVYAGIAIVACEVMPLMFNVLGWGVRSWI